MPLRAPAHIGRMPTVRRPDPLPVRGGALGAPGRRADITVFSADLMKAPFADIPKAHAVTTIVAGQVVHG